MQPSSWLRIEAIVLRFSQPLILHGQASFLTDTSCYFPNPRSIQVHDNVVLGRFLRDLHDFVLGKYGAS